MVLVVLVAPMLGAIADILQNKKLFLALFTGLTVVCTAALYFIQPGMVFTAAFLFILANAGFEGGLVFYDAFLPEITTESNYGRVSGYGYALGYLGSLSILGLCFPFVDSNPRLTFLITAAFFFVFAWPIFLFVPERPQKRSVGPVKLAVDGFRKVIVTIQHLREYKNVARFLLAFFLYNDAVLTVILFAGIYASSTLHFTMTELAIFFAMIQVVAVAGSLIFGRLSDRKGPRFAIIITLIIWSGIVTAAYFIESKSGFFVIGGIAGIALGSSQSCSRSLMALLTPVERKTEFFGFYEGFCGKASAIIGPIVFGLLSDSIGQRPTIFTLIVFFVVGLALISTVKEERAENMPKIATAG
jgi:UMF1 family MFS transporter